MVSFLAFLRAVWAFKLPILMAAAFASGVYVTHKWEKGRHEAVVIKALAEQAEQLNHDVLASVTKSAEISTEIQKTDAAVDKIKAEVKPRIIYITRPAKAESGEVHVETQPEPAGIPYLDQRTVRMLNSARGETPAANAASVSNGEEQAPSATSVEALIQSDLDITKMYQSLAQRHDALVDYVLDEMKRRDNK